MHWSLEEERVLAEYYNLHREEFTSPGKINWRKHFENWRKDERLKHKMKTTKMRIQNFLSLDPLSVRAGLDRTSKQTRKLMNEIVLKIVVKPMDE